MTYYVIQGKKYYKHHVYKIQHFIEFNLQQDNYDKLTPLKIKKLYGLSTLHFHAIKFLTDLEEELEIKYIDNWQDKINHINSNPKYFNIIWRNIFINLAKTQNKLEDEDLELIYQLSEIGISSVFFCHLSKYVWTDKDTYCFFWLRYLQLINMKAKLYIRCDKKSADKLLAHLTYIHNIHYNMYQYLKQEKTSSKYFDELVEFLECENDKYNSLIDKLPNQRFHILPHWDYSDDINFFML